MYLCVHASLKVSPHKADTKNRKCKEDLSYMCSSVLFGEQCSVPIYIYLGFGGSNRPGNER
jgi:hypothetical protein